MIGVIGEDLYDEMLEGGVSGIKKLKMKQKWNGKCSLHGGLGCDSIVIDVDELDEQSEQRADKDAVPVMRNLLGKLSRSGKDLFVVDPDRELKYMMEDLHTDVNVKLVNDYKEAIAR